MSEDEKKPMVMVVGNPGQSLDPFVRGHFEHDEAELQGMVVVDFGQTLMLSMDLARGDDATGWCVATRKPTGEIIILDHGQIEREHRVIDLDRDAWREMPVGPIPRQPAPPLQKGDVLTMADVARIRAAEQKRARKAAKRRREI